MPVATTHMPHVRAHAPTRRAHTLHIPCTYLAHTLHMHMPYQAELELVGQQLVRCGALAAWRLTRWGELAVERAISVRPGVGMAPACRVSEGGHAQKEVWEGGKCPPGGSHPRLTRLTAQTIYIYMYIALFFEAVRWPAGRFPPLRKH